MKLSFTEVEKAAGKAGVCLGFTHLNCLSFTCYQRFSHLKEQWTHLRDLLKPAMLGLRPELPFTGWGAEPENSHFQSVPCGADAAGPRTHPENCVVRRLS